MKIVKKWWDAGAGYTDVLLQGKYGKEYFGDSVLAPEDEKYKSEQIGFDLAFLRATLQAQKDEFKEAQSKVATIKDFISSVEQYKAFTSEEGSAKAMYRQLNRRIATLDELEYNIKVTKWLISQIAEKGVNLDNALLKLESAIDKDEI